MAEYSKKLHIRKDGTVQDISLYTDVADISTNDKLTIVDENTKVYAAIAETTKQEASSLRIRKNNTIYAVLLKAIIYNLEKYYKKIPGSSTISTLPEENASYIKEALPNVDDTTNMFGSISDSSSSCVNIVSIDTTGWDTSNLKTVYGMFEACKKLTILDTSKWNTGHITNMDSMFRDCESLKELDVSNWDTTNVTNMDSMFYWCQSLTKLDVSKWDTNNVTDMNYMFGDCSSLTKLDLSKWDTSNVKNISGIFSECYNLSLLNVSNWNTSNVTNMVHTFNRCDKLTEIDISNWDTSKVKYFGMMFNSPNLTTIKGVIDMKSADTTFWNTDAVILTERDTTQRMFENCTNLKGVKIKNPPADFETYSGLTKDQYEIVS